MTTNDEVPAAGDGEDFPPEMPTTGSDGEAELNAGSHGGQVIDFATVMSGREVPSKRQRGRRAAIIDFPDLMRSPSISRTPTERVFIFAIADDFLRRLPTSTTVHGYFWSLGDDHYPVFGPFASRAQAKQHAALLACPRPIYEVEEAK